MIMAVPVRQPDSLSTLYLTTNQLFDDEITDAYPLAWDEDYISYRLCRTLQKHSPFEFERYDGQHVRVNIVGVKNPRAVEGANGDIGVIVRFQTRSGKDLIGVGYLEAKRRYPKSGNFDAVKAEQLERIAAHTRYSFLLLYDYDEIVFDRDISRDHERSVSPQAPSASHAVLIPAPLALALGVKSTERYDYAAPLAHQICFRYLHGLDLEFLQTQDQVDKHFAVEGSTPSWLLVVTTVATEDQPPEYRLKPDSVDGGPSGTALDVDVASEEPVLATAGGSR